MTNPTAPPTPAERLILLRAKEALRIESLQSEAEARELEALELAERLSEGGQVRGKDFEIVNTPFGVFGVKKPDARGVTAWDKVNKDSTDAMIGVLRHYILPDDQAKMRFHQVATERQGVVAGENSVAKAFLSLIGAIEFDSKKK